MKSFDCEAVLFDLDGVLVNSNVAVEGHWRRWAQQHGLDAEAILKISHGRPAIDTIREVAPHSIAEEEGRAFLQREAEDLAGVVEVEGVANLLNSLPERQWAIVTSGTQAIATNRLRHVGLSVPKVMITTDDISRGKPDPEGYLKAASRLGVAPERCLVVEDAVAGVKAARAAGMIVVAVATTYQPADLIEADAIVPALVGMAIEQQVMDGDRVELRVLLAEA
ncbi:HAD family hydrolase [Chroococcidiopsis sp.]|uniref:HAD family hydrolase n=1 Tax=Chroococcidiopsis sp. TaxID=3088168 RepID=UPI003F3B2E14